MKPEAYQGLGRDLAALHGRCGTQYDLEDSRTNDSAVQVGDVVDLLVDFFRANDPDFSEGEFVGSTYGA